MDRRRVGIVIPAFNESQFIFDIVKGVKKFGLPIVVDDGSCDQTKKFAKDAGAIVISNKKNLGYDKALNIGFQRANKLKCKIILTIDADGQHNPDLINKFLIKINKGYDLVLGVRKSKQRFSENLFGFYANFFYGVKDPLCGLKAYKIDLYRSCGYFDSYQSIGTELLFFAIKHKFKFSQIQFDTKKRDGTSRFGNRLLGNYKILRSMFLHFINKFQLL
jgi:glycosyltransferase involved in cell wall biosynthesis